MLNGQDIINDSASANLQHIIQDLLKKREPNYCKYSNIRLFIGTWNVNGRFDDALAIEKWLMQGVTSENELPDIYALGFQELEITWGGMAFNKASSSSLEERWINLIERSQPFTKTNYYRIQRCRMAAIFVVVYVRASLRKHIKDDSIIISSLPTGIMNVVGNKGATAIRFQLFDDQLCFVNVHMAAGENNVVRRNQDYLDISSRLVFNKAPNPPSLIENHDIIFIFGDMNYRIAQLESATVKKHIDKSQIQELLTFDELGRQKQEERIFQNFQEAGITFRPTYKFDAMTNTYDSSDKNRIPSFCDRVLWKCDRAENVVYTSVEALMISDHKPVVAYFNLKVKQIDATLYRSTYESVIREIDTAQNAILPQATLSTHDLDFGEIHLMEAKQASLVITNTGKYAFSYDFKGKNDTDPKLPEWITIAKGNKRVAPGESETLTLEVYVNPKFVRKFHTGDYTFDDILILDLQNGKDFFLTTHGRLAPTSFGLPLSVLLSLNVPICDVNAQELLNKVKKSITQIPSVRQPSVFGKDGAFVVPKEIFRLADHIYLHGLQQEELFRQPGVHLETQSLRQALDNGSIHDALPKVSVHSVMETLMTFVESMYDTIIPKQFYDICIESSGDRQKSIEALRKLPVDHRNLFIYITSLLHEIIINSQHNGVEYGMIAEVFGDIVFRDCPHRYKKGKAIKEFMKTFLI